jgi:ATP synthase protein I
MSVSLYSKKVARKLLFLQLLTFVLLSAAFGLKSLEWSISALAGGLAAWLPNAMFMLFAWRHQAHTEVSGRVAGSFAIGEALKVIITIVLLIIALGLLKAAFVPLGLAYVSVLLTQILAPIVIKS